MESNVSRTVTPAEEPQLFTQARPFTSPNYLDGIGFLYDRGTYMEIRYDGCHHGSNFLRNGATFAQAAAWVRKEMATCGPCESQARVDRVLGRA